MREQCKVLNARGRKLPGCDHHHHLLVYTRVLAVVFSGVGASHSPDSCISQTIHTTPVLDRNP
jgi:hypothetical protein